jgi:hypothetical protein
MHGAGQPAALDVRGQTGRRAGRDIPALGGMTLWVPRTSSASRDQAILVDQTTDADLSSDAVLLKIDRFGQRFQRRRAVQETVRPVLVVVVSRNRARSAAEQACSADGHPSEIYCQCDPGLAARRYNDRAATCHPIHVLASIPADVRAEYDQPVGIGTLVTVNTATPWASTIGTRAHSPRLPSPSPAVQLDGAPRAGATPRRTRRFWCCATRSRCRAWSRRHLAAHPLFLGEWLRSASRTACRVKAPCPRVWRRAPWVSVRQDQACVGASGRPFRQEFCRHLVAAAALSPAHPRRC